MRLYQEVISGPLTKCFPNQIRWMPGETNMFRQNVHARIHLKSLGYYYVTQKWHNVCKQPRLYTTFAGKRFRPAKLGRHGDGGKVVTLYFGRRPGIDKDPVQPLIADFQFEGARVKFRAIKYADGSIGWNYKAWDRFSTPYYLQWRLDGKDSTWAHDAYEPETRLIKLPPQVTKI